MWRMAETRVIRKYANRRLYDATDSRHVTLEDIRKLIAGGERVQVVDDRSGVDLTRCVLLQIIYEQEQLGAPVLGMDLLEGLIRSYGSPTQHLLAQLMGQSVRAALQSRQNVATAALLPDGHE
jgi:polyhydroxyalkanoate synthesis repressor PhaR